MLTAVLAALLILPAGLILAGGRASAATPPTLNLRVLLVGGPGGAAADPTTAAWAKALTSEGVPFTEVDAAGSPAETVSLPVLSSGSTGNFNGIVIADSPNNFAAGQLSALFAYESAFGVRQVDGYMFPDPLRGANDVSGGPLDGTTGALTSAGLAGLPELKGPIPFDSGTYGYTATGAAGASFTAWLDDAAGHALAGVYQHPSTDAQAGISELSLFFNYNSNQLQWLLLAPGLINWVTNDIHLGLYRNYFGQDIDDNFISDNEWSSQFQCTPAATDPPDFTCPTADQGVAPGSAPGVPADVQMSAADVAYVVAWEKQTGITLNLAFNGVGACTADNAADQSSAKCSGSITDKGGTFTDPGQAVNASYPNDAGLVNALLANQAAFNWINHTWSHLFLGCTTSSPQALSTVTANGSGGTLAAGTYSYEVTAATAYGESEPSGPQSATVPAAGSVSLTWPEATNGAGADGTAGPSLAEEEASHTGGTGFWGYYVYREDPGATTYGLVGQVPENPGATAATTYSFTDAGAAAGRGPNSDPESPTATNPGIDCASNPSGWLPATSGSSDSSIEQEIALNQAFAAANGLTNYSPAAVVTGEHSGIENPNMSAALAGTGITTFAEDASRQPQQYSLGAALGAPRYPSNIYYNASNWPDELNEYNTLYVAQGASMGPANPAGETGHCASTSATTCVTAPLTEAGLLASESHIMLSHVLDNDPRVGYAHQTNLIGPATLSGQDYGYTILSAISNMLAQYNSWYTAPLSQMTDVSEAQVLANQAAWTRAAGAGSVSASETNGVVTIGNSGSAVNVPVTMPSGTTANGSAFGQAYGGPLSDWVNLGTGATETLDLAVPPAFTSSASATSIVGAPFSFKVATSGAPNPALTEAGALPGGLTFTDNSDGTATIAGTPAAGSGGSYPFTLTATNPSGSISQAFTLTNAEAPTITSPATAAFVTGVAGTYHVTTTGFPAATISENGALPAGLSFAANGNGTAAISGTANTAGTYPVSLSATNASGSTSTLALTLTVGAPAAPTITSPATANFTLGQAGSFAVTTTGAPAPALAETGVLPAGLTFADQTNGVALLSGTPTAAGSTNVTVTAANGQTPNATQTLSIVVGQAPAITSAATTAFSVGAAGTFKVTTSGYPAPSLAESGALPSGVTFKDNGDGTAALSGTPAAGTTGSYQLTVTATNGTSSITQSFTLAVNQAPAFTSTSSTDFPVGSAGSFAVITSGVPAATITETGTLPSGVTFKDNGDGTATLAGTPAVGAGGTYPVALTATNSAGIITQNFTLSVDEGPAVTSTSSTDFSVGTAGTFAVTTTGSPAPSLTETGALPPGVTFKDNGNGTATLAGTPAAGTAGSYPLTFRAANGTGTTLQSFILRVDGVPGITSAAQAGWSAGTAGSFTVTTSGYPAPSLTENGALPSGVTFKDNGNGTATLAGTPATGTGGFYPLTITATNSSGRTTQAFTVKVAQLPRITSAAQVNLWVGTAGTFKVTTSGYPAPAVTERGTLPPGVAFRDNGNGTASLAGTPASATAGAYQLTFTAKNASGAINQSYTLIVSAALTIPRPGGATDIGIGANGSVWIIGRIPVPGGYGIYRWNGRGWTAVPGGAVRIAVDGAGNAWIVNSAHRIYHWTGRSWASYPGTATDVGVGANGSVWIIGSHPVHGGYGIYRWNGRAWATMPGAGLRIAVDQAGNAWVVNSAHRIYHWTGRSWASYPGAATDIGVGANGSVLIVGTNPVAGGYGIYHWNGRTWTVVRGGAVGISVDPRGNPWVVDSARHIYSS